MSEKILPSLVFNVYGTDSITFGPKSISVSDQDHNKEQKIDFPIIIPIIDLEITEDNKEDFERNLDSTKINKIFYDITGREMPENVYCAISKSKVETDPSCMEKTDFLYFLIRNSYGRLFLVDWNSYKYSRLLLRDIFILYVNDSYTIQESEKQEYCKELYSSINNYIIGKQEKIFDLFNYVNTIQMTVDDALRSVLNHMIYKMLNAGYLKENISFLIVYDDVKVPRIMDIEKTAQEFGIYYESILLDSKISRAFRVDSPDINTINISNLSYPLKGKDIDYITDIWANKKE